MHDTHRILTIIPKSATTIIGIFHNERCIYKDELSVDKNELAVQEEILDRQEAILESLNASGINLSKLHAVSAVGGLLRPVEGGTYVVNEKMITDLACSYNGKHASNLGGILAKNIADDLNIPAYIIDPPVVDEIASIARISGYPGIERKSVFHALNQKAAARQAARSIGRTYQTANLIVAHIGNGISIGAHKQGKVIDVNNGLHGDGPFSLERSGTLPLHEIINLCFSEQFTKDQLIQEVTYKSGLKGYLTTTNLSELKNRMKQNDPRTLEILNAMGYQISKEIGAMAAVLSGAVDAIVLTGELARIEPLTDFIMNQINWISDVLIYAGEAELEALNAGTLRVLRNEEQAKLYQ